MSVSQISKTHFRPNFFYASPFIAKEATVRVRDRYRHGELFEVIEMIERSVGQSEREVSQHHSWPIDSIEINFTSHCLFIVIPASLG